MNRTERQVRADCVLDEAIREAALAYGNLEDHEFVGDWAISARIERLEQPTDRDYINLYSNGTMPSHCAVGLFAVALDHLRFGDD